MSNEDATVTDFQKAVIHCLKQAGHIPPALLIEELGNRLIDSENEALREIAYHCHAIVEEGQAAFNHFMHELRHQPQLLVPKGTKR